MSTPKIEVKTNGISASILIDGEEFADKVLSVSFEHDAGGLPVLSLNIPATDLSLSGEFIPALPAPFDRWYSRKQKDLRLDGALLSDLFGKDSQTKE